MPIDSTNNYIETIKPIVIKKYNTIYYCFNTEQAQYIYNSFLQRDFYINKYNQKKTDFDYIVSLYEEKISILDSMHVIDVEKIAIKDTLCNSKNQELEEIENVYKQQLKKTRNEIIIAGGSGLLVGLLIGILL